MAGSPRIAARSGCACDKMGFGLRDGPLGCSTMPLPLDCPAACRYEMDVEIPWDLVAEERERLVKSISKSATVPGFRQGRVPATVLNRHYEPEIIRALAGTFVPQYVIQEVLKRDVEVATGPYLEAIRLVEGAPLKVHADFEVFPKFELKEYRGLPIRRYDVEVTDEMVDGYLEDLRSRHATYQNLDPRPMVDGDIAVAVITAHDGDKQVLETPETHYEIGAKETMSEISEALLGKVPGETVKFQMTMPQDHGEESLAGKLVSARAEIKGLTSRELPELDDEFAKDVDNSLESLEDLRASVRETYGAQLSNMFRQQEIAELFHHLASIHQMDMPTAYMASRWNGALDRLRQARGVDDNADLDKHIIESALGRETIAARAELILDRIAAVEGITVSESEIAAEVQAYAQARQLTPQRAVEDLRSNGALNAMRDDIRRNKVASFVLAEANSPSGDESDASDPAADRDAAGESGEQGA